MFEFKILESGRVKCPKCDASCARRDLTFRHLRAMHKLNPDGTPCDSRVVTGKKQKKQSCDTLEVPAPTTTTFTRHLEISDQPMTTKRQPTGREIAAAKEINCVHQEDDLSEDDQPTVE